MPSWYYIRHHSPNNDLKKFLKCFVNTNQLKSQIVGFALIGFYQCLNPPRVSLINDLQRECSPLRNKPERLQLSGTSTLA